MSITIHFVHAELKVCWNLIGQLNGNYTKSDDVTEQVHNKNTIITKRHEFANLPLDISICRRGKRCADVVEGAQK